MQFNEDVCVRTSFPTAISRSATTCSRGSFADDALGERGKTITAFGSHEWLANATAGATQIPIGVREGAVRVKVLVVNYAICQPNASWNRGTSAIY